MTPVTVFNRPYLGNSMQHCFLGLPSYFSFTQLKISLSKSPGGLGPARSLGIQTHTDKRVAGKVEFPAATVRQGE